MHCQSKEPLGTSKERKCGNGENEKGIQKVHVYTRERFPRFIVKGLIFHL